MKIALIGYGKMGKSIEALATEHGHSIYIYDRSRPLTDLNITSPDVAIEFSSPDSAEFNIKACLDAGIPVVCGTTGWTENKSNIEDYCRETNGTFFYASNFSLGVNLFFRVNEYLAELMCRHAQYHASITEVHHTQKKDAPSGTAISLAEGIIKQNPNLNRWILNEKAEKAIPIHAERKDPFPGTHTVLYQSSIDEISITHQAHSRKGFAAGALEVAEWIPGRKGILTMRDFLGF